jgi:hypothetical protein
MASVEDDTVLGSSAKNVQLKHTLESAQLHALPTSTGHEILEVVDTEMPQSVATDSTQSQNLKKSVVTVCSLKSSPYFSLYRRLQGPGQLTLLAAAVLLSAAARVPLLIIGFLFGKIINSFPPPEDELRHRLAELIGVALAYFVVTWGWAVCWGFVGEMISQKLRKDLVEKLLGLVRYDHCWSLSCASQSLTPC